MKKLALFTLLIVTLNASSQSVFGYWYGKGNIKTKTGNDYNNYLVELILSPEKGYVKGILNYYFKNTYRSTQVKGNYDPKTRQLSLYNIPVTYHGSLASMEVDCNMTLQASHRIAKNGDNLIGAFIGLPEYKYMCTDINFNLGKSSDMSKQDSVLKALREFKETNQVWRPTMFDTLAAVNVVQRKVINYVIEDRFKQRENIISNEIEVASDSIRVDFYDNGEIDGDSISIFFNKQLLAFSQRLSSRAIHFDLKLDSTKDVQELSMYADNLGSIPPNTALMIVTDGKKQQEIRLASNLDKNATIRIRRKKK
jgi:hypothetical protein